MSKSTNILYDLIERRLDALSTTHPYLEASGDLPVLRQSIADLKGMHALELDAVRTGLEVEQEDEKPMRPQPQGGALRTGRAKK